MFVDKTEGNDKSCHSSAYPEMTGNKGTHHVNFLSPIGEGWANTLTVESQVHTEVKGHGNNERHHWHEQRTYRLVNKEPESLYSDTTEHKVSNESRDEWVSPRGCPERDNNKNHRLLMKKIIE